MVELDTERQKQIKDVLVNFMGDLIMEERLSLPVVSKHPPCQLGLSDCVHRVMVRRQGIKRKPVRVRYSYPVEILDYDNGISIKDKVDLTLSIGMEGNIKERWMSEEMEHLIQKLLNKEALK